MHFPPRSPNATPIEEETFWSDLLLYIGAGAAGVVAICLLCACGFCLALRKGWDSGGGGRADVMGVSPTAHVHVQQVAVGNAHQQGRRSSAGSIATMPVAPGNGHQQGHRGSIGSGQHGDLERWARVESGGPGVARARPILRGEMAFAAGGPARSGSGGSGGYVVGVPIRASSGEAWGPSRVPSGESGHVHPVLIGAGHQELAGFGVVSVPQDYRDSAGRGGYAY